MWKTLLFGATVALGLLLIYAATRPATFRVQRSERIQATPGKILPLISDLQKFNSWNPYLKKDPLTKGQYGPTTAGPGASYAWESDKVGTGSMTVQEVAANRVTMRLDFRKPFEASNLAEFTLAPRGDTTEVTWAMSGAANFMSKLMVALTVMDRMVGNDFASGLSDLKTIAEAH